MKNRELFHSDPIDNPLLNNGVAAVTGSEDDVRTLQYELNTFVCEGEYSKGLAMILGTYLGYLDKPEQPAVWVSGFYGSGKSHLVKVLRYLWTDFEFEDKTTARGLVHIPKDSEILAHLKELDVKGRQNGGLHAAAGTLGSGSSVQLAVLRVLFRSKGLPLDYPAAKFVLWLKARGHLDKVRAAIAKAKGDFDEELRNLYVSTPLAEALLSADPKMADSPAAVLNHIEKQFPPVEDISTDDFVACVHDVLADGKDFPCTAIILDEVQQFIGEDTSKSYAVQEVVEALSKRFKGRIMVIGTGQAALTSTPQLSRLKGRFTRNIHLSDTDVETVIRKVVLEKKPDKQAPIAKLLETCAGEINRHLVGTKIEPRHEDNKFLVADYPLLPVRQRFWEKVIRRVDAAGLSGQLRTQLKIAHEAAGASAPWDLGTVVPADFIFDQIATEMLQTGVLPRELYNMIMELMGGSEDDKLCGRLCATIFLVNKLRPESGGFDLGIRATPPVLADLLVDDLKAGSAELRKRIPQLLDSLVEQGRLMKIEEEYRLQTAESTAWELDYRQRLARILADDGRLAQARVDLFRREIGERLKGIRLLQGKSKVSRNIDIAFGDTAPETTQAVPVWVRNEWDDTEKNVMADARAAGMDSPLVTAFIPRRAPEDLKRITASMLAAQETLNARGNPSTQEGQEARSGMDSRAKHWAQQLDTIFNTQILSGARVILAGGQDIAGMELAAMVTDAANKALVRLFPEFDAGDHKQWDEVFNRAKAGAGNPLEAVGHKGDVQDHPVCAEILRFIGPGKKGNEIRRQFEDRPYGWSREAINAALVTLVNSGHLKGQQAGRPLERSQMSGTNIGVADFRVESVTVTAAQRIAVRSLYQGVGISCASGEEGIKAGDFLRRLQELADAAGGTSPLPARPDAALVKELSSLSGNEQIVAIFDQRDQLTAKARDWQAAAELAARRLPRWKVVEQLLAHAQGLPVADEVMPQMNAITTDRSLLSSPDPVPALAERLASVLRGQLVGLHQECEAIFNAEWDKLAATDTWQKIGKDNQPPIARDAQIKAIPDIKVGTEEDLLGSLNTQNLEAWRNLRDALPARFAKALMLAAQLLEPKAVRVSLPSATITNEKELDEWLAAVRDEIAGKLGSGPVII